MIVLFLFERKVEREGGNWRERGCHSKLLTKKETLMKRMI